ncbi:MAG: ATP-binding cassette domain-containing protein [Ilumatobacteraceae bacterium]
MTHSTISTHSLSVGYDRRQVVGNMTFDLVPGNLMVLIGTNGSGKSTLLKTLAGMLAPISGSVSLLGHKPGALPARVAFLPQHPVSSHTLPLRAEDVVGMGRFAHLGLIKRSTQADRIIVDESMLRTGVNDFAKLPLRLLSGGQQQRTHLAQVLARRAEVLLLDEPTAGLDVNGRGAVANLISQERSRGVTVVLATHEISDADNANIVMLLAQRVVAVGPPLDVLRDDYLRECFGFTQPH